MTAPTNPQQPTPGKLYVHLKRPGTDMTYRGKPIFYIECLVCGSTFNHYHPEGWQKPKDFVMGLPESDLSNTSPTNVQLNTLPEGQQPKDFVMGLPEPNTNPVTSAENKEDAVTGAEPGQQPEDDELFDDSFYEWLERYGVIIEKYRLCKGGFEAIIDLNKLKPAMLAYADRRADKRVEEARNDAFELIYPHRYMLIDPENHTSVYVVKANLVKEVLRATHHPKGGSNDI